jgi:hypothetical protein
VIAEINIASDVNIEVVSNSVIYTNPRSTISVDFYSSDLALEVSSMRSEKCMDALGEAGLGVIAKMVLLGFFERPDSSSEVFSGVGACVILADEISRYAEAQLGTHPFIVSMIDGLAPRDAVIEWVLQSRYYTASAVAHIEPSLNAPDATPESSSKLREFLEDEREHWRIYSRILNEIGHERVTAGMAYPKGVERFVGCLRANSQKSAFVYAGNLMFIEQIPEADSLEEDPLYSSLIQHYQFSQSSISPLWQHAIANATYGHDSLGAEIICGRNRFATQELDAMILGVKQLIDATRNWYDELQANFR